MADERDVTGDGRRTAALDAVRCWLDEHPDVQPTPTGDDGWLLQLRGEHKRTIGLQLSVGDRTLIAQSHFMRAPDDNSAGLYELLLKRHQRSYTLRFCIVESGDIMLVGLLPLAAVDADEVDRLVGAVLTVSDETYNAALRLGFAAYIEREQQWRAASGMPRNPIT